MAYGSLAHGLLTGSMGPDTKFEEDDWRRNLVAFGQPIFEGEHFLRNLERVEKLKEIAASKGKTVAQLAMAWVLSSPAVTVGLVGIRRPEELEENVQAADWAMTESDRQEISAVASS
jgi:hypothetical protein